jgi:ammonia channel protein AmtB
MTMPGLALFYGGLVRSKNMLSVLMQVFVTFSLIVVLWVVYGYSLAFTEGNAFIGGFDRLFLKGVFDPPGPSRWAPPSARACTSPRSCSSPSRPPSPPSPAA